MMKRINPKAWGSTTNVEEDATDPARPHCRRPQCLEAAPTEPLTGVPQSEDASDVALYVQQSLTWATAVVDRARDQQRQMLLRVFLALRFQVRLQLARHSPQRPPTALTWKMLQRVFSGWRRVMHGSRVREGQALQKMKVLREGQIVLMEWSAQSRAQKRTARWHAIFVRLYRRVRAHRELILIQHP
eukprot:g21018.t1